MFNPGSPTFLMAWHVAISSAEAVELETQFCFFEEAEGGKQRFGPIDWWTTPDVEFQAAVQSAKSESANSVGFIISILSPIHPYRQ